MKNLKRYLSFTLVLIMLISALPLSSLAEDIETVEMMQFEEIPEIMPETEVAPVLEEGTEEIEETEELEVLEIVDIEETETELPAETDIPEADQTPAEGEPGDEMPAPEESIQPEESIVPEETPAAEAGAEAVLLEEVYYARIADESGEILPEDLQVILPEEALPLAEIENLEAEKDYTLQDNILLISAAWISAAEAGEHQLVLHSGEGKTFILPLMIEDAVLMQAELEPALTSADYDVSKLYVNGVCVGEQPSGEGWRYDAENGVLVVTAAEGVSVSGSGVLKYIYFDVSGSSQNNITFDNANISFVPWQHKIGVQGSDYSEVFSYVSSGDRITVNLVGENTLNADYLVNERSSEYITFRMSIKGEGSLNCGSINVCGLGITGGAEVTADDMVWSNELGVSDATLNTKYLRLREQYSGEEAGKLTLYNGGIINAGQVSGGYFNIGDAVSPVATLNINGIDAEYGLHIASGLNLKTGGVINVTCTGDDLNYTAIVNEGNYQQLGGDINITLSGHSDFTGIYMKPQSVPTAHNGNVSVQINGAFSARGIIFDSANTLETGVKFDVQINNTVDYVSGIYAKGKLVFKDTCNVTIAGGTDAVAVESDKYIETRGDTNIKLSKVSDSAIGLAAPEIVLSSGNLNVDANWTALESYALYTASDFKINGGKANLSAALLAPANIQVITKSGPAKYMNSSRLTWDGTTLSIPGRIEFFVNSKRQLVFEDGYGVNGDGWIYIVEEEALYLDGFNGGIISFPNHEKVKVYLFGQNSALRILCAGEVEFMGEGSLLLYDPSKDSHAAIDANTVNLASGNLEIKGYTHGINAYDVHLTGGSLAVSDCVYGVTTNTLDIGGNCSLNLKGDASAFKVFETAMLAGSEFNASGIQSIEIAGGEVISQQLADGLTVGGVSIAEAELNQDHSGEGWMWVAEDQQLVLDGYTGGDIVATFDTLNLHAREGISRLRVYANTLNYTADSGVWMRNAHIEALQLNLLSGSIYLRDNVMHTFDYLNISGGRLNAPDVIEVNRKLKVSGGSLVAGKISTKELEITGGSVNVTDETQGVYEQDGVLMLDYSLLATNCLVKGGELTTVSLPLFGDYKQTGGKANLNTSAAQMENNMLFGVFVSNSFSATGGSVYINNACEEGVAMFATKITLGGKVSGEFFGGGVLFSCDDVTVAKKKVDGYKYRALTMSKGERKSLSIDDLYVMMVGGNYYTAYMANNMNFSGKGWSWNHDTKTLTLSGYDSRKTSTIELFVSGAKVHLQGGSDNYVSEIYSDKSLTVTGTGKIEASSPAYTGENRRIISPESITINGCTNLNLEIYAGKNITVKNSNLKYKIAADGNVSITGSTINMPNYGIEIYGNLTVKSSVLVVDSIYCLKKVSFSNSIVMIEEYSITKVGKSISSNTAYFEASYSNDNRFPYILQKNATLSSNFTIPDDYVLQIPSGKTLTISSGKTLYTKVPVKLKGGKIKGNVVVYGTPESMQIAGPNEMATGSKHKLDTIFAPEGVSAKVRWLVDNPALAQIDADGNITISTNVRNAGKTLKVTAYAGTNDAISATHEITITPAVQELVIRQNGREVKSATLWLDPNANKTTQFYVHSEPTGSSTQVTWKSSSTSVATVDANGVVTAKKAGTAYITATAMDGSGITSPKVKITVKKAPTSVKFTSGSPVLAYDAEIGLGTSKQLACSLSSGSASSIAYASQNEAIAIVDENGLVTATGVGKTTITARTYNGKTAKCTVSVKPAPESIELNIHELIIGCKDSFSFSAAIPSGSAGSWTYSVSNENAAINAGSGAFTALKAGEVDVVVTSFNGKTDTCKVKILPAPEVIALNKTSIELGKGESFTLDPLPMLENGGESAASFRFTTSNKKAATVSSAGKISAKAAGTAIITVIAHNGVAAECEVKVRNAPSSVKIAKSATLAYDAALQLGTQQQLNATLSSKSASALTWKSSNEAVVTVDSKGLITATGVGAAKITVRTFNKKSASCTVTVKAAPSEMLFGKDSYVVAVDDTLSVSASPNSGSYTPAFNYAVENPAMAAVDESGLVTPAAVGETRLIARAFNGAEGYAGLKVVHAPTGVSLNESAVALKKGKKFTILPVAVHEDGVETAATFSFASSKTKVASVNAAGVITAKAKGTAIITVSTHNGHTATIQVKVP